MPRRGLDYDDPIPDVTPLSGPLTATRVSELAALEVAGLKADPSVTVEALAQLVSIPSLRRLDLSNRHDLRDQDLAFLADLPQLTAVSLARCGQITDAGVRPLRACRQLEQVNLQWTSTGDGAIDVLTGVPTLGRLLVGARFTDAGAARLRECPALAAPGVDDTFLSISSARGLTDAALESIGALTGVQALDVHMSVFGSPHYTARGVAHLRGLTSLDMLNFHGRLATDAVLREIAGIPRLRSLHCQDIVSGDEGFEALGRCETLESLATRMCANLTARGLAALARLPRLKSLGVGGPRVSDDGYAPLAEAQELGDINPTMSRDGAFVHLARIPRLERLNNMYNRATTDAATRCFRDHPHLAHYSAFGTQITDDSLRVLASLPRLQTVEIENCPGITDAGLRDLSRAPALRRLTAWSCVNVAGEWTSTAPAHLEAKSDAGPPGQAAGYRFETVVGYPDLSMPADGVAPRGAPPVDGRLSTLVCFGGDAAFTADGVELSIEAGRDTRWLGVVAPEVFTAPVRIEAVVRPVTELRLFFGRPNHLVALDAQGFVEDDMPWFTKMDYERGEAHGSRDEDLPGEWVTVALETDRRERRLFVDGRLRHVWRGDFTSERGRVGIGLRRRAITVKALRVEPLPPS